MRRSRKAPVTRTPGAKVPNDCIGETGAHALGVLQPHMVFAAGGWSTDVVAASRCAVLVSSLRTKLPSVTPPRTARDCRSKRDTRSNNDRNATGVHSVRWLVASRPRAAWHPLCVFSRRPPYPRYGTRQSGTEKTQQFVPWSKEHLQSVFCLL